MSRQEAVSLSLGELEPDCAVISLDSGGQNPFFMTIFIGSYKSEHVMDAVPMSCQQIITVCAFVE